MAEFDQCVCRGRVEGEDERAEGFEDVHACFTEAEGGEGDGREEDEAKDYHEPERDPIRHVALDAIPVGPVGEETGVEDVEEGGKTHGDEEFPGCDHVPTFKLDGRSSESFAGFLDGDDLCGNEDRGEEDEAWKCADSHDG